MQSLRTRGRKACWRVMRLLHWSVETCGDAGMCVGYATVASEWTVRFFERLLGDHFGKKDPLWGLRVTRREEDMCKEWVHPKLCLNFQCPHNLFWEGLGLNTNRIHITNKAIEIRNCCCYINKSWTLEEIAETWGLTKKSIKDSETSAWRKIQRKPSYSQLRKTRLLEARSGI